MCEKFIQFRLMEISKLEEQIMQLEDYDPLCSEQECPIHPY